jgi:hypothetical protein
LTGAYVLGAGKKDKRERDKNIRKEKRQSREREEGKTDD